MARYSTFTYSNQKYGSSTVTEKGDITWVLQVDWDADGNFDGTSEADRLIDVKIKRGNKHYLSARGRGFERMRGGNATLILDNYDRRYDPRYSSSPLYPNVEPGKKVSLSVIDNSDQSSYDVLIGQLSDIRPLGGGGGGDKVRLVVDDYMQVLWNSDCNENASELFITLARTFVYLLHDLLFNQPVAIDAANQPVPVGDVSNKNAGQVLNELAHAGMGQFFCDKSGVATYYARNHTGYTNHAIDESVVGKKILLTQPWDHVYNKVTAVAHRPIRKLQSVIWFLPNPEPITNGVDKTIYMSYKPADDIQVDTFEANTDKAGNGTNITANVTITDQQLGVSYGYVTFTPTATGFITKLEIRGRQFDDIKEEYIFEDTTSQGKYGIKKFTLDTPYLQDPNYAVVFSEVIKDFAKDDREGVAIEIYQRASTQFALDIMHTVDFTAATLDINDTYYITGYEHKWNKDTGQDTTTTVYMHKIATDNTSITDSEVETQNPVPLGYENPAGDPGTIGAWPPYPSDTAAYFFAAAIGSDNYNHFFGDDGLAGTVIASGQADEVQGIAVAPYSGSITIYTLVYGDGSSTPSWSQAVEVAALNDWEWVELVITLNSAIAVGSDSNYVDNIITETASVTAGDVLTFELWKTGGGRVYVWGWLIVYD